MDPALRSPACPRPFLRFAFCNSNSRGLDQTRPEDFVPVGGERRETMHGTDEADVDVDVDVDASEVQETPAGNTTHPPHVHFSAVRRKEMMKKKEIRSDQIRSSRCV